MWQRIQTLYLVLSAGIIAALFFCPLATVIGADGQSEVIAFAEKLPYLCLMISILTAHVFALVLFKRRIVQMRVATIAALLAIGFQIWIGVDYFTAPDSIVFKVTAVLPLIAGILDIMAVRGIAADQMMVESMSRLRTSRKNRRRR